MNDDQKPDHNIFSQFINYFTDKNIQPGSSFGVTKLK